MDQANPSRRSTLAMLATGPIALLPALAVAQCSAKAEAAMISPDVSARLTAYHEAERKLIQYSREVATPASEACELAVSAIPHHRTASSFLNAGGTRVHLSTENEASVATARRALKGVVYIESNPDADYWATVRELVEADDERKAKRDRLRARYSVDAIEAREEELGDRCSDALVAFMETPARTIHDVLLKAELTEQEDGWEAAGKHILADVRRLAGRA